MLYLLDKIGIRRWGGLPVMRIHKPEEALHGGETLELSFRLVLSRTPVRYKRALDNLAKPVLVLAGTEDEVFWADRYESVFAPYPNATVHLIPGETHDGILSSPETHRRVEEWWGEVLGR